MNREEAKQLWLDLHKSEIEFQKSHMQGWPRPRLHGSNQRCIDGVCEVCSNRQTSL